MKTALITGVLGQDGTFLAELLLSKGYEVHGLVRSAARPSTNAFLPVGLTLHFGDVLDPAQINRLIIETHPDEIYHLAAPSYVPDSWKFPSLVVHTIVDGTLNILEAMRCHRPGARFYQASSSEMYGTVPEEPQSEKTRFNPASPYGTARATSHWLTVNYRESYGLYACSGILFNHESERRQPRFLTKKVAQAVASAARGLPTTLQLGDLTPKRDWGFSGDYVRAMWMMLQADKGRDYVVATGVTRTVEELVRIAFSLRGLSYLDFVKYDKTETRPVEVPLLRGDATRIHNELGWKPTLPFEALLDRMISYEEKLLQ